MHIFYQSQNNQKEVAKNFYKKIERVWCPILNKDIIFDSAGFRHLIQKTTIPRSKSEQHRRFLLLPDAVSILGNANIVPKYFIKNNEKTPLHLWVFSEIKNGVRIMVVIKQSGNSGYHFLSVYGRKQKSTL